MSEGIKRPYAQVMRVAECLVDSLRPACHRIEIAGSLRRQKPMCTDIEIVAIPILHTNPIGEAMDTSQVDDWLQGKPLTIHKNGQKYKQFSFEWQPRMWFKVDLFLQPDPATWGVNFLLRTGSSDFSHKMVTARSYGGYKPDVYTVEHGRVRMAGMLLPTPEERDVFDRWEMKWIEPKDRL
jgi:DNA polymerase/3'-5' exonuclease PolX